VSLTSGVFVQMDRQLYYPLMTVLLCLCDREYFESNWWSFVESSLIHPRMMKVRGDFRASVRARSSGAMTGGVAVEQEKVWHGLVIECLTPLVDMYLTRTTESADAQHAKLTSICAVIFPAGAKRLAVGANEPLSLFVDFALAVCRRRIEYGMEKLIIELLKGQDIQAEYARLLSCLAFT
jgi:hypothetical protein